MFNYAKEGQAHVALPELTLGDHGNAVGWVQVILNVRGFHVEPESVNFFDRKTMLAVMQFQQEMKLAVTGTVDALTWACLLLEE